MKSQIIFQNRIKNTRKLHGGFLTMEILLAFSIFTLFTVSTFVLSSSMQELKIWSIEELDRMKILSNDIINNINLKKVAYGNDTSIFSNYLFSMAKSDYIESWGRNSCYQRFEFNKDKVQYFPQGTDLGISNPSTDIEVRNSIAYLSADSTTATRPDLFIIDTASSSVPRIMSTLNTGPGISSIEVAGPYIFAAQSSTVNQLQIIDIHDIYFPQVISQIKLPLPTPTTTAPFATSIFYSKGYVYLGTVKWAGAEFSIIDVSNIHNPVVIGTLETNTLINDIYVTGNRVYIASSDEKQMRILDISNKTNPVLIDYFSPDGWQTQEGKILDYFEGSLGLGRTVGGFNVTAHYEGFIFSTSSENISHYISEDIPGGVYGMILHPPNIFVLTHFLNKEFQVFSTTLKNKIFEMSLGSQPLKMACDGRNIFFATGNSKGISILKL